MMNKNSIFRRVMMKFSQFCEEAENTEKEQQLLQFLKEDEMRQVEQIMAKMARVPIIGKSCTAVIALINCDSLAEFKRSAHYKHLMNFNFTFDFDQRDLFITPSDAQIKNIVKVLAVIGASTTLLILYRKFCSRKK